MSPKLGIAFDASIACRRLPAPLSLVLVTIENWFWKAPASQKLGLPAAGRGAPRWSVVSAVGGNPFVQSAIGIKLVA